MAKKKVEVKTEKIESEIFISSDEFAKKYKASSCIHCGYVIPNFKETEKCPNCDENPYHHVKEEQ